ncbi:helix-turn-helix domain-containing protein [Actinomadura oligospora]|uniref:AraC-like ligand-binding domain-containing protein n=1 Tax=Actinomadura oligospora TaxID=111804 RepID=UPI0004B1AF1E|nr:helix-turn-helix domain-containing protein [Actinomadura oligospora]
MASDVQAESGHEGFDIPDSLPVPRRRLYWREALARTFGAVNITVPDEVYAGTIRTAPIGRLRAVTLAGDCQDALRTRRLAAQDGQDDYVVVKMLDAGVARLEQDGREAVLGPGDVFVYDLARPIRLTFPQPFRTKSLVLPKAVLGLSESDVSHITARRLASEGSLGALLSPFVAGIVDGAGGLSPRAGELMARNIVDLLGTLTDEILGRVAEESPGGNRALLLRIQAFIDRHLADPDLTPQAIAETHHISLRYLHKLFEIEDVTVSRWIQRRRLEECRRDLALHGNATIAAVAHRWGFASAAHFSRVFRAAYGMTPREWRGVQDAARRTPSSGTARRGLNPMPASHARRDLHLPRKDDATASALHSVLSGR